MSENKKFSAKDYANAVERTIMEFDREQARKNFTDYKQEAGIGLRTHRDMVLSLTGAGMTDQISRITSAAQLRELQKRGRTQIATLRDISQQLHTIDSNYVKLISYHANMFHVRYMVIPKLRDGQELQNHIEEYHELLQLVDGLGLEALVPTLLKELFISGAVNVYFEKYDNTETISSLLLPANFCRTSYKSSFGTNVIEFNFEYFESFSEEERKVLFEVFPPEFEQGYRETSKAQHKWLILDPMKASAIQVNDQGMPPFLNMLDGVIEYEKLRDINLTKEENELVKLLVNEVPLDPQTGLPIFEVSEMQDITRAMRSVIAANRGIDIITAFGKTSLHQLQSESRAENKTISQAFETVYSAAGVNPAIFAGKTDGSIEASRDADKSFVWAYFKQLELILNVVLNTVHEGQLQAAFQFMPITMHKEQETVKIYREQASFGIGKLDAIIASGIKQSEIQARAELENILNLENILKPLQSSHTSAAELSKANEKEDENDESGVNKEEVVVEDDNK